MDKQLTVSVKSLLVSGLVLLGLVLEWVVVWSWPPFDLRAGPQLLL